MWVGVIICFRMVWCCKHLLFSLICAALPVWCKRMMMGREGILNQVAIQLLSKGTSIFGGRSDSICRSMVMGISRQHPWTIRPSSMLWCSLVVQNCLQVSQNWWQWSENPLRMMVWSCWYCKSCAALSHMSWKRVGITGSMELRACISKREGSTLHWVSHSAIVSSMWGSFVGWQDNASEAQWPLPLVHCAVKLYPIMRDFRRCSLGFSISSNQHVLRIESWGLWSVNYHVKLLQPCKKYSTLHDGPCYSKEF